MNSISLKELLLQIRETISMTFESSYWIRAEISEIRENANGHCYLELIEKNDDSKLIEAKIKASIWANVYRFIKPFFKEETGEPLRVGMKILVEVNVSFHEIYGLSCSICNIDPTFTIGDLAKKKKETIQQLKEDGIWDMNKSLDLPVPLNRIAVISSNTAAGYEDFCNQLQNNSRHFCFITKLFPAAMQGENAANSIINALDDIFDKINSFDAVAIIRGGGASTDLLAFDEYDLACNIAQFPIPILTGIGHERDESIADMVAHTRCKTPTAVAAFLIENMINTSSHLEQLQSGIFSAILSYSGKGKNRLTNLSEKFSQNCKMQTADAVQNLKMMQQRLRSNLQMQIANENHKMELYAKTLKLLSPETILKKGYTLTFKNGKVVKSAKTLKPGDKITTFFADGEKISKIE